MWLNQLCFRYFLHLLLHYIELTTKYNRSLSYKVTTKKVTRKKVLGNKVLNFEDPWKESPVISGSFFHRTFFPVPIRSHSKTSLEKKS